MPGGWSGHTYTTTQHGYYGTGERQGEERFYHQDHTTQSLTAYNLHKQSIEIFGYISKFRYFYPTAQILTKFTQQGFTVIQNTNIIQVSNSEVRITWRLSEKTIIRENLINSTVVKTIITKYKYFESVGQDLKYKETEIIPDILENGDCIEIVAETTFDGYNTNCTNEVAFRTSDNTVKNDDLRVIPNPASDIINIVVPKANDVSKISIISVSGQLMYSGNIDSPNQIDVSLYPSGLYIIHALQGTNNYISKFFKQ